MSTVRINIEPAILQWIQKQVNLENIKNSLSENFYKWLSGEKQPTFKQIEDFSKGTHIPLGYFFLTVPPEEDTSLLEFRTVDSEELRQPSRDLLDTITDMENIQDWMRDFLEEDQNDKLPFVKSINYRLSTFEITSSIRTTLGIDEKWFEYTSDSWDSFKYIRERLEECGIIVMMNGVVGSNTHRPLDINEFRAFTLVDDLAPLIFINANDSNNGRLFSLFHELTHIWFGVNSLYNELNTRKSIKDIEVQCNAVAAELLVPQRLFTIEWKQSTSSDLSDRLHDLSKYFNCGTTVIARRAYDSKFISLKDYQHFAQIAIDQYKESKKGKKSGGNYYNTALTRMDKRVLSAMYDSAYSGKSSFTDVYRLTKTSRKTFENLVQKARGSSL